MPNSSIGSARAALLLGLAGLALAACNLVAIVGLGADGAAAVQALGTGDAAPFVAAAQALLAASPAALALPVLGPLLLGLVGALVAGRTPAPVAAPAPAATPAVPAGPPPEDAALRLLALLQHEARFIDFIREDIDAYDDAQVGAAVREIHAGCRKALAERMDIAPIFTDDDGASVEVAAGFDPGAIRLTGNVTGEPPFRGALQHCGWRVTRITWPAGTPGTDAKILAPAEVEVG